MRTEVIPLALITKRLTSDPFLEIDLSKDLDYDSFAPLAQFWPETERDSVAESRHRIYDAPRVRYFRDRYRANKVVPAVHLKVCSDGIRMWNGYHRLCGAILADVRALRVALHIPSYDPKGNVRAADTLRREARDMMRTLKEK